MNEENYNYTREMALALVTVLTYGLFMKATSDNVAVSVTAAFGVNILCRLGTQQPTAQVNTLYNPSLFGQSNQVNTLYNPSLFGQSNGFTIPKCEKNERLYASLSQNR